MSKNSPGITGSTGSKTAGQRKSQVLALLEECLNTTPLNSAAKDSGRWVSGELISERLGISRAAVSKHVGVLRREGHIIDSAPRRGFCLRVRESALTADEVCAALRARVAGKGQWRCLEETTSTSSEAVAWASEGALEGSLVLAERQTRGRGRKGHDWFSAPRGLQFSLILRPRGASFLAVSLERAQELLTRMAALSVAEAVRALTSLSPVLKAPNDVLLGCCKFCGVLVETGFQAGAPDWVVIGIGCNVNALPEDFPAALRGKTCSILSNGGKAVERPALLREILERLDYWYEGLNSAQAADFGKASDALETAWQSGMNSTP